MIKLKLLLPVMLMISGLWAADASAQADWKLKKSGAGIEVYVRDVAGSRFQEFKGIMYLKQTRLASLVAVFDDPSTYTTWMHEVVEARLLKTVNLYERYTYTVTRAPWPVTNRDLISYSIIAQDPKTLTVTLRTSGKADFIPPVPDRVRVPRMNALWTFKPLSGGDVMVTYQMHSEPGGYITPELANMAAVDLPYNTLFKLRNFLRQPKYASIAYPQIREPKGSK
ncbi:MAG: START domain-containing protein [Spirochaetes bacterium]|nr:START domain-containing protein [Spirochaetota bacterium]